MRSLLVLTLISLIAAAMTACALSPRLAEDPLGESPEDFTIDLTILSRPADRAQPQPAEAHLRQSRIVLFADGSLHYGVDPRRGSNWLPGLTRRLSREQVVLVWELVERLGLADPIVVDEPVNFDLIEADPGTVAYLAAITAFDERWAFLRSAPIDGEPDEALTTLIRALAQLAWVSDLPEEPAGLPPRRYDFGPDPYERYRR